jgi:hypothetical protein
MSTTSSVLAELAAVNPSPIDDEESAGFASHLDDEAEALFARILASGRHNTELLSQRRPLRDAMGRPGGRRWTLVAASAALVAAAAGGVVAGERSVPSERHVAVRVAPSVWRLTANLNGSGFQASTDTPDAISYVTCMDARTCFLSAVYGLDFGGQGALYVSHDGGYHWAQVPLPAGLATTTNVSCAGSGFCAAGAGLLDMKTGDPLAGKPLRDPELLVTTDGGATWSTEPVPLPADTYVIPAGGGFPAELTTWPGWVDSVICSAPGVCNLLGHAQVSPTAGDELVFATTMSSGQQWTQTFLPERPSEVGSQVPLSPGDSDAMTCPSADDCDVTAWFGGPSQDVWRTADSGVTWSETQVAGAAAGNQISCPDINSCWIPVNGPEDESEVMHSDDGGLTWSLVQIGASGTYGSVSCVSASVCYLAGSGIAETTDGGHTWTAANLPPQVGPILSVSCDPAGACVAAADPAAAGSNPAASSGNGTLVLTNAPPPRSGGSK